MIKYIVIKIIKALLWLLDKSHRQKHEIAMDDMRKFTHTIGTSFRSDFARGIRAFRTVPYECWELKTETKTVYGADKHLFYKDNNETVWLKDCIPGETILRTNSGTEAVISVRNLDFRTHMYDVEIDHPQHWYWANGILSHNTTCAAAFVVWRAIFKPDQTILIAANKNASALEIMQRIRYTYEELPEWLKAGAVTYNKGSIEFDNGSRIISRATTPDAGRGLSISLLYLDEFAFVKPRIAEEFWTAIQPTLSTGGDCIITSTPNSDEDQFAKIWFGAENNVDEMGELRAGGLGVNGFKAIKVTWEQHPDRDDAWAQEQIQKLGIDKFDREFNCKFIQEDETLIHPLVLANLTSKEPIYIDDGIRWFQQPEANKTYVVGYDPAVGTGGDFAAIQVFQMPEMEQIAEWKSNNTDTRGQVGKLQRILKRINDTMMQTGNQKGDPEIYYTIENNTVGEAALQVIEDTGEENFHGIFMHEPRRAGLGRKKRKGMTTTNKSKVTAAMKFKSLVETDRIKIYSKALISELKGFVRSGVGFQAKYGYTDDVISASLLCIRMVVLLSNYDPDFDEALKETLDDDDYDEPMPIIV